MWNIFTPPIEKLTIESWAKISDDIAKIAILAIPVILYGNYSIYFKFIHTILLFAGTYAFLLVARLLRQNLIQ